MEFFWTILPFIAIILIAINIYSTYKEQKNKNKKPASGLNKYNWYKYLKLVFIERVRLKNSILEAILLLILFFSFIPILGGIFYKTENFIYPNLPLEKMQTKDGVIKNIRSRKGMQELLVLTTDNGDDIEFAISATKKDRKTLVNRKVKVWYRLDFSSLFSVENYIQDITINNKSVKEHPYSYEKALKFEKKSWNFTKYCFYIALFSAFILWIQNRKELPVHRLGRMKLYKKIKGKNENGKRSI